MSENPTKTILLKVDRPERLCRPCAEAVSDTVQGRYNLKLTPARSRKAKCACCGRMRYTLKYTPEKEARP
ncbi:MAG: hypothetical protein LUD84_09660 [Clostridiales bacterium]|nr:hypothetical protein [Clostridiales bacterium]